MNINGFGNGGMLPIGGANTTDAQVQARINSLWASNPEQAANMELQQKLSKEQELVSTLSNIMKKLNDMNMAIINNLR